MIRFRTTNALTTVLVVAARNDEHGGLGYSASAGVRNRDTSGRSGEISTNDWLQEEDEGDWVRIFFQVFNFLLNG